MRNMLGAVVLLVGCGSELGTGVDAGPIDATVTPDLAECVPEASEGRGCFVDPTICVDSCGVVLRCVSGRWAPAECEGN